MVFASKKQIGEALKKTTRSQRGQTARSIMREAPEHKMSGYETEKFLRKRGVSERGAKEVRKSLEQPEASKPEKKVWEKPQTREMEKQQPQQPQKGGVRTPSWVEKVGHSEAETTQAGFGGQQNVQKDVRIEKAGQMQPEQMSNQESSDVGPENRAKFEKLEQQGLDKNVEEASRTDVFNKLDEKDDANAKNIDALLGGGSGEEK